MRAKALFFCNARNHHDITGVYIAGSITEPSPTNRGVAPGTSNTTTASIHLFRNSRERRARWLPLPSWQSKTGCTG